MSKFFDFKIALLVAILLSSSGNVSADLNCTEQPACTDLGYSTSDVDNCQSYIYCPFDTSYKACTSISCTDHRLFNCPTNAKSCTKCSAGGHTLYKVTECEDGYTAVYSSYKYTTSGDVYLPAFVDYISDCVADCSDYTLTECIANASCDECTNDGVTTYKFTSCNDGYYEFTTNAGDTVCRELLVSLDPIDCSEYTLTECIANASCAECTQNSVTTYKFLSCNDGYLQFINNTTDTILCSASNLVDSSDPCDDKATYPYECTGEDGTQCFEENPCADGGSCKWACNYYAGYYGNSSGSSGGGTTSGCDDECLQSNSCECYKCKYPDYCTYRTDVSCCGTSKVEDTVNTNPADGFTNI